GNGGGEAVKKTVAPGDAPAILHQWVVARLASAKGKPAPALDSKVEAKQLADLSRSRQRVGDWTDALALLEASFLLDPNQPELNADAMAVLKIRIDQILLGGSRRELDLLRRAAPLHRRGLAHMEALVVSGAKVPRFDGGGGG